MRRTVGIKAHLLKRFGSYVAYDGLDQQYVEYLDQLCARIEARYGDRVWWTTMSEIAERMRMAVTEEPVQPLELEPMEAAS